MEATNKIKSWRAFLKVVSKEVIQDLFMDSADWKREFYRKLNRCLALLEREAENVDKESASYTSSH